MKKKTVQANSLQCRALLDVSSFNKQDRTIEVVFATETPVRRWNWELGEYMEVLEISKKAIDFTRMNAGAPVLDTHSRYSITSIIGVVEKAWVDETKKEARALLRLSGREDLQQIVDDIESGIIRNISVGYSVSEYTVENADKPNQEYRATKWMPAEISFVPIPADHNSGSRSEDASTHTITILNSNLMPTENTQVEQRSEATPTIVTAAPAEQQRQAAPAPAAQAPVNTPTGANERAEGVTEERTRVTTITETCQRAGLDTEFSNNLITTGASISDARAAIIDEVAARQNPAPVSRRAGVTGEDEGDQVRSAIELGLFTRSGRGSMADIKDNERAKQYANMRMLDLAKDRLRQVGTNVSLMDDQEIVKRALATTDFPNLLTATFNRSLRGYYDGIEPEWRMFARQENASDFREKTGIKVDGAVTLEEIPEGGEYKESVMLQDETAKIKLRKYGRKYSITDIAIINDDLGVFTQLPRLMAIGARMLEAQKVWGLITGNAKTPDGTALFHANHGNLGTPGAAIGEAPVSAARTAMRRQKSPAGKLPLGVKPQYLIVPPELETAAQKFLASVLASKEADVNIFSGSLKLFVADILTNTQEWYLAADPKMATIDGLVYSYLNGQESLKTESRVNFDTDSLEVKGKLFFDAAVWGWQGWYKNAGA